MSLLKSTPRFLFLFRLNCKRKGQIIVQGVACSCGEVVVLDALVLIETLQNVE